MFLLVPFFLVSIHLVHVQLPFEEAGLPEGCENIDMLPSSDLGTNFSTAIKLMQKPAEELFETLTLEPNCIISDICIPWTAQIAKKHHIPRIAFNGFSSFALLCLHNVYISKVAENITSVSEHFVVPEIPDHIEITKVQLPASLDPKMKNFTEQRLMDADVNSYGVIIKTFEELEQEYVKGYKKVTWPLFADQFLNEKFVAQVLKIGVRIGVEDPVIWGKEEKICVLVKKDDIKEAIEKLMDEGEESEERRKRVREIGKMAKKAVEEGGSSYLNMTLVIQEILQQTNKWN
ncbi:Glycosyltransferase [Quillaja saponaria]|uniref:Glycosyltransferase n=1 Tax=Quillaja saponaria TaxID=32244 RepID=A0AAD7Q000_QUISA|nr:Glycosyltransferase [Quillaja saponaria]